MAKRVAMRPFEGWWKILDMEMWDLDYIDLVVPGYLAFEPDGLGRFQFGAVQGWIDCRGSERDGAPFVEFSWHGDNDGDDACGRGFATLGGDRLAGRLYIHCGDDSAFTAERRAGGLERPSVRRQPRPPPSQRPRR